MFPLVICFRPPGGRYGTYLPQMPFVAHRIGHRKFMASWPVCVQSVNDGGFKAGGRTVARLRAPYSSTRLVVLELAAAPPPQPCHVTAPVSRLDDALKSLSTLISSREARQGHPPPSFHHRQPAPESLITRLRIVYLRREAYVVRGRIQDF